MRDLIQVSFELRHRGGAQYVRAHKGYAWVVTGAFLLASLFATPSYVVAQELRPSFVWGKSAWGEAFFASALDTDGDGLTDEVELSTGTNTLLFDSDADGLFDGTEVALGTNPLAKDSDGDGFSDAEERDSGTDPLLVGDFPFSGIAPALFKVFSDLSREKRD